jgi:hypothetical protein
MCVNAVLNQVVLKVFGSVHVGYTRITYFVNVRKNVFLLKVMTLVLLMFNFMKLAAHQPCKCLISVYSRVQLSAELIAQK